MKDPIIEEIRETRRKLEHEYCTTDAYLAHLQSAQKKRASRLVKFSPRLVSKRRIA